MPDLLASSSKDGTIKLWQIPEEGFETNAKESLATLETNSTVGIMGFEWHDTVNNMLASYGLDRCVRIWDVSE